MDQMRWVLSLNVLGLGASSDWESFPKSHLMKYARTFAVLSIFRTEDAPHSPHRHRCVPAEVVPFFIIFLPQMLHLGLDTAHPRLKPTPSSKKLARTGVSREIITRFFAYTKVGRLQLEGRNYEM